MSKVNRYLVLDDELLDIEKKNQNDLKEQKKEKQRLRTLQKEKQYELNYYNSIRRTLLRTGGYKEDNYYITKYLYLDSFCQSAEFFSKMKGLFSKDDYIFLTSFMTSCKDYFYCDNKFLADNLYKIMNMKDNSFLSYKDQGAVSIYQIYIYLLIDTVMIRKMMKDPKYSNLLSIFKDELEIDLTNQQLSKYFELNKRFFAKRNNFKILFTNYVKFIGKMMIIKKRFNKIECDHYLSEDCDYMCPNYDGEDFGLYLNWHMFGDIFDSIPLPNKKVRELVDKFWLHIDEVTQLRWEYFVINKNTGITKYGKKELQNNNT